MRVVLDSNIYVAAFLGTGVPAKLFEAASKGIFEPITTDELLRDLTRGLSRPRLAAELSARRLDAGAIVDAVREISTFVASAPVEATVVRDSNDIAVLRCAVGGSADFIVTSDKDLLVLREFAGIAIMTPLDCLRTLGLE